MTRLKCLWWKFLAWVATPWWPKDKLGNPRSKKRRGDPMWVLWLTNAFKILNVMTGSLIIAMLMIMIILQDMQ